MRGWYFFKSASPFSFLKLLNNALPYAKGFAETAEIFFGARLRQLHDHIFDSIRIRDLTEDETLLFGGGLNIDIAEVKNRWEETIDGRRNILDVGKFQLTDLASKESFLFDIDDALVGNDPDVKIVIDPYEECVEPHEEHEGIESEIEEAGMHGCEDIRKDGWYSDEKYKHQESNEDAQSVVHRNIKPVTMNDAQDFFRVVLALEMIARKRRHIFYFRIRW